MRLITILLAAAVVAMPAAPALAQAAPVVPATPAAPAAPQTKGIILERVLVRVNGEILTQSELTQRQIDTLREQNRQIPEAQIQAELSKITPEVLVNAVDDLLLVQRGREMGMKFTEEQFKQAIENIKKQNKLDDEGLRKALAQEGITMEQLRQQFEKTFLVQSVQQREIGPSMTITQEEQRQFYQKHPDQFMTPETVSVRELFISVPSTTLNGQDVVNPASDAAARTRINELRSRAVGGADFQALVTQNSDAPSKSTGGLIGPIKVEDVNPVLLAAIAGLEPGGVTEPIKAAKGYQIFKLEARAKPQLRPFDSVRGEIETAIRNERIEPETRKMLAKLRTQAVIEWKDDTYRQIYEKQVAAR